MVQLVQPLGAHVGQSSQFPEPIFLGCSPVQLLLDDALSVFVIVDSVDESQLGQMSGPVSVAGLSAELSGSRNLFWGRSWFRSRWLVFLFGSATFSFVLQNLVFVSLVPLPFSLSYQVWIVVGHTEHN